MNADDAAYPPGTVRVLIFSADIGEGHDLPARVLREAIVARQPDADVTILDTLTSSGSLVRAVVRGGLEVILRRLSWMFDMQYWLVGRFRPTRRLAAGLAARVAGPRLLRAIGTARPDVVVCTYPLATEILGRLRLAGRLEVPVVSAITDLAALGYWAHPGCDVHLLVHSESEAEVRAIAGRDARVEAVRGLTSAAYDHPVDRRAARAALGLPADAPVVIVSGGGWGVGDLRGAVAATLAAAPDAVAVALCGHNARVRSDIERAFRGEPRVRTLAYTDRMSDLLAAADVLVHSTAGLTVLEALIRGVRVISYGWGVGHVRVNNRAYARLGLADVVTEPGALPAAIRRALASPPGALPGYADRSTAADRIIALVGGVGGREGGRGPEDRARDEDDDEPREAHRAAERS